MADELARHGYKISPGTLYPALHHMEDAGLIESRKEVRNGRAIRLYRATDLGRQTLEEEREMLFEFVKEILGRDPRPSPEEAAAHSDA